MSHLHNISTTAGSVSNSSRIILDGHKIFVEWIACEVTSYITLVITTYLLTTLTFYHIRGSKCWTEYSRPGEASGTHWLVKAMNATLIMSIFFSFLRCFFQLDTIWGRSNEFSCIVLKKTKIVAALLAIISVCITYWLRQRVLYRNPQLASLTNAVIRFISTAILPVVICLYIAVIFVYVASDMGYRAIAPYGCSDSTNTVPLSILGVTTILMQLTLVFLFAYPLMKHRSESRHILDQCREDNILPLVKRAVFTVTATVIINLICVPIAALKYDVDDKPMTILDVNLILFIFCSIFCFSDWKRQLLPCAGE